MASHRGPSVVQGTPSDGQSVDHRWPSMEMKISKTAYAPKKSMYLGIYASMDHRRETEASIRSAESLFF